MNIESKYNLELNFPGDGRCFLNFWDSIHGNDVVVEVENGELWYTPLNGKDTRTISFWKYLELVKESINKRTI